ncbi:MAG: SRPBCC family protein [Myxococcales bacterium]|nr:SRPBCC family protein [Myxococcales bacterium]
MSRWLKVGGAVALGFLLLVGGALSAVYAMQPDHFRFSRSRTIAAAPAVIRPHLIDVRELHAWLGGFADPHDPPVITFSTVSSGVGAWVERKDSRSLGRMTLAEVADSQVRYTNESHGSFGTGHSSLEFVLTEKAPGSTQVEYVVSGDLHGVPRLLWSVVGLEKRMGPEFDEKLQKLEAKCVP